MALVELAFGCLSLTREMVFFSNDWLELEKVSLRTVYLALSQLEQCQDGYIFLLDMKLSDAIWLNLND